MKKALEELWDSGVNERYPEWSEDDMFAVDIKDTEEEDFRKSLTEEQRRKFDKLVESAVRLGAIYEKKAFSRGYTLATRILIESLFEGCM